MQSATREQPDQYLSPASVLEGTGFEPSVPLFRKGLSAVAEGDAGPISWMGPLSRSSRETTMVGRGVSLHGRLFLGTDGSNPVPSGSESDDADRLFGGRFCGCTALSRLHAFLDERRARLRRRRTPARTQRCLLQAARIAPSKPTTDVVWSSIGKVCSWSRFKAASVPRRQRVVLPRRETAASREA